MIEAVSTHTPHDSARVLIDRSGCVHARSRDAACSACIDSCPAAALRIGVGGPLVTASACLGCGRCVPVCPTEVIRVAGFPTLPMPGVEEATSVSAVDCWRVPDAGSPTGSLRLPCLGGLDTAELLTLNRLAGPRGLALLDRGWCGDCPAGGSEHPLGMVLVRARELLVACGVDEQSLPRLVSQPLPVKFALPAIPEVALVRRVSRRDAFRALLSLGMESGGLVARPGPSSRPVRELRPGRRRPRLLAELATAGADEALLAGQRPLLKVATSCAGHATCASICPGGALRVEREGARSGLYFEANACTACGLCVGSCPEAALQLAPAGGSAAVHRLTDHTLTSCRDCGATFVRGEDTEEDRCYSCRRSGDLARNLFGSIGS